MNQWALITGASSGIGIELARIFAAHPFNLVLTGRNMERLDELAGELRQTRGIQTRTLAQDLAEPGGPATLFQKVEDLEIDALVNNAGLGFYGDFAERSVQEHLTVMQVNMFALVELTHLFLKPMLARRRGRILNAASMAAFQPGPCINVYYASKAFVHSFSYALAQEVEPEGITVTALCPGTTRTEFFSRGRFSAERAPFTMEARPVAEAGYRGLMRGRRVVIPGWHNRFAALMTKFLPLAVTSRAVKHLHRRR